MKQLADIAGVFAYLSLLTVGGGMAAFPELKELTVNTFHWLTFPELLHYFSLGQLAPGPNMMMVASVGAHVAGLPGAGVALVAFILPTGSNSFMTNLTEQAERTAEWLAGQRAFIDILHVDVFDPDALAGALEQLSPAYHGVATVALDHARVRAAIDDLAARNVAVVTLVSDAPNARRMHYVGIDNPAAGRTAATLMGRFLSGRTGPVAW